MALQAPLDFQGWLASQGMSPWDDEGRPIQNRSYGDTPSPYQQYIDNFMASNYPTITGPTGTPWIPTFVDDAQQVLGKDWTGTAPDGRANIGPTMTGPNGATYVSKTDADAFGKSQNSGFWDGPGPFLLALGAAGGVIGGGALGGAAAGGSGGAANAVGLAQMAADAGLTGSAADAFIASGGTMGSTAAGGGGLLSQLSNIPTSPLTQAATNGSPGYSGSMVDAAGDVPANVGGISTTVPAGASIGNAPGILQAGAGIIPAAAEAAGATTGTPGVGDAGAFDQTGSAGTPQGSGAGPGGNFWQQLLTSVGLPANLASSIPTIAGALGSYFGQQGLSDAYLKSAADAAAKSDPFASQRDYYQGLLKNSYTDPNFFNSNSAFTGIRDQALNATAAKMASQGYNGSGNQMAELAKVATNEGYKYAQPWQAQVAQNAGAGISPGYAGYLSQQGANNAAQANYNAQGQLGVIGQQLYKALS